LQISYWCSIVGHEYFTEVPESFIEDQFNLTGLNGQVPFYQEAMAMILDSEYGILPSQLCKISIRDVVMRKYLPTAFHIDFSVLFGDQANEKTTIRSRRISKL
jgi:Casein kinase II regulatory subunit